MPRPVTASKCSQEIPVLLAGRPVIVVCQKAEAHPGPHQGPVTWPVRVAAPAGRRI